MRQTIRGDLPANSFLCTVLDHSTALAICGFVISAVCFATGPATFAFGNAVKYRWASIVFVVEIALFALNLLVSGYIIVYRLSAALQSSIDFLTAQLERMSGNVLIGSTANVTPSFIRAPTGSDDILLQKRLAFQTLEKEMSTVGRVALWVCSICMLHAWVVKSKLDVVRRYLRI